MTRTFLLGARGAAAALCLLTLTAFDSGPRPGQVIDEARAAGRDAASFPAADEDYFHDMDGGIGLTPEEVKGRNMWNVWSGGNDRFWDTMTASTFGAFDLLKIVAYDPDKKIDRDKRWNYLGLDQRAVLRQADRARPRPLRLVCSIAPRGLPGRPVRQRWQVSRRQDRRTRQDHAGGLVLRRTPPASSVCGCSPIRTSMTAAAKRWDSEALLQRSRATTTTRIWCGHTGSVCRAVFATSARARSIRPPTRRTRMGQPELDRRRAIYVGRPAVRLRRRRRQLHVPAGPHLSARAAMDTSLVSTDNINNPRTMNAVYSLGAAARAVASAGARRLLTGGELNNKQFNDFVARTARSPRSSSRRTRCRRRVC